LRVGLILIPVIALGFFGFSYINPSGELVVDYDFCQAVTPYFSGLSPYGRVLDISNCEQSMVIDPVYFDVRLPQSYRQVDIGLDYDKPADQELKLGVGVDPDNWQWEFGHGIKNPASTEASVGRQELSTTNYKLELFNTKFEKNRYRFIISAPGLDSSGGEIKFYNMKLKFTKEPLTKDNFWQRLRNII